MQRNSEQSIQATYRMGEKTYKPQMIRITLQNILRNCYNSGGKTQHDLKMGKGLE